MLIELAKANGLATEALEAAKGKAVDKISEVTAENEVGWAAMTQNEKLNMAKAGFNTLSEILGKESAAGKAAAIGAATISTYQSAVSSYNSLSPIPIVGPVLGGLAAGAAVVAGIANVKKIISTKTPGKSVGGAAPTPTAAPALPPIPSVPPSFNMVGSSDTNQLADAIGGQSQTPVQAYVVSNDVTTAQELDRNIINGASIG